MGRATVYCEACGAMIPPTGVGSKGALSDGRRSWCGECADKADPAARALESDPPGSGGAPLRAPTTQLRRPAAGPPSPGPAPAGGGGAKLGIAAGAVALAVVVALAFAFGKGDGGKPAAATAKARAAVDKARDARGRGPASAFLDLAVAARREASGTELEREADALFREASAAVEAEKREAAIREDLRKLGTASSGDADPASFLPGYRDLADRARLVSDTLAEEVRAAGRTAAVAAWLRRVQKVDPETAVTRARLQGVLAELDAALNAAGGPSADPKIVEEGKKRRAAAEARFGKAAEEAAADLEKRLERMIADRRFDEAANAIEMLRRDFEGTPAAARCDAMAARVAEARKVKVDGDWIELGEKDWELAAGDAKATATGRELAMSSDAAPEEGGGDMSRRVGYRMKDGSWTDFELELEFMAEKVGGAVVLHPVEGGRPFTVRLLEKKGNAPGITLNRWTKLKAKVEGVQLTLSGDVSPGTYRMNPGTGGFALVVFKGAKWQVRNARIRKTVR
jgi:hypothetical protein